MKDVVEWSGDRWDDILSFLASSLGYPSLESVEHPINAQKFHYQEHLPLFHSQLIQNSITHSRVSVMRRLQILVMSLF